MAPLNSIHDSDKGCADEGTLTGKAAENLRKHVIARGSRKRAFYYLFCADMRAIGANPPFVNDFSKLSEVETVLRVDRRLRNQGGFKPLGAGFEVQDFNMRMGEAERALRIVLAEHPDAADCATVLVLRVWEKQDPNFKLDVPDEVLVHAVNAGSVCTLTRKVQNELEPELRPPDDVQISRELENLNWEMWGAENKSSIQDRKPTRRSKREVCLVDGEAMPTADSKTWEAE